MGMCSYCTQNNCSCNDNPTDGISKQIHEKLHNITLEE